MRARCMRPITPPCAARVKPTVILAKTVKGSASARAPRARWSRTSRRSSICEALKELRDRFNIPVSDADLEDLPFRKPAAGQRGDALPAGAPQGARRLPAGAQRRARRRSTVPPLEAFRSILDGTGEREISTTMAFVRILTVLLKDKSIGKHIVPIVPDEARTFGMEGLFRQIGIYSAVGQLYTPVDAETLMSYREDKKGQMLEEGINEAGSTCSWIAAATSYANHGISMVPFYIYYSMFGFQRVGDFLWAAGDMRARGFLLGAHRRSHDAGRRGPAASGRTQPAGGDHDAQLPRLRSDLRLRAGGDHPGRPAGACMPITRASSITSR